MIGSGTTLEEFLVEWWDTYAVTHLQPGTLATYTYLLDKWIVPYLGRKRLRDITRETIDNYAAALRADGAGAPTINRTLGVLQGVFHRAVEWRRLQWNPVLGVRRLTHVRDESIDARTPEAVEAIRAQLDPTDAALVSVLAYEGLRPGEAFALSWEHVGERTILVERSLALGELKETKTRSTRSVRLLAPLRSDLNTLRIRLGRPADGDLVFPRPDGQPWRDTDWRNWRNRVFQPAAKKAGLSQTRPYDLRHSFVSVLIAERRTIIEVAGQAGHSPTMTLDTYGHVFDELEDAEPVTAEDLIRAARAGDENGVSQVRPERSAVSSRANKNPAERGF